MWLPHITMRTGSLSPRSSASSLPTHTSRRFRSRFMPQRAVVRATFALLAILCLLALLSQSNNWRTFPSPSPHNTRTHRPVVDSRTQPNHRGVSRIPLSNGGYTTGPLPSLKQAFNHLHPLLNHIKNNTPEVPPEHDMTAPIFSPFIPAELEKRYAHLTPYLKNGVVVPESEKRILLVAVCRQVAGMLPDWFATYTVLADFLGPESLVVSLLEGSSQDGSGELLAGALRKHLLFIGVPPENIFLKTHTPAPDWEHLHRIEALAQLRNDAMAPIFKSKTPHLAPDGRNWTHVIWHNDVYFGAQHVLELLHQHEMQDSDITCGWDHAGKWFYDGWVGRDMSGDLYSPFPVPKEDEDKPAKFFVSSPSTRERFERTVPFQVFSGWNGMLVMNPTPFAPPYNVRFRRGTPRRPDQHQGEEECQSSESMFLNWDFWRYGFGRVLTVPGVHLTYGKGDAQTRGWVVLPQPDDKFKEEVTWINEPPAKVRCHDWPDKLGKAHWAWGNVRWTDAPAFEIPEPDTPPPPPGR